MAKTLKDFLNERQLGPMVVKNPDEQKFIDKHVVAKTADRNGNDDELFKGSKVKMADRPKHRKGYNPGEDEEVYEAVETERVKHPVGQRPKGAGWVLKSAGEQTGKDHSVWERKFKRVGTTNEELKGNQHKIDANKNGKVDAHDFKLLRGKKKKVSEEAEELEELSKSTMGAYTKKAAADFSARKPKMGYDGQLKKMQNRTVGVNRALDKMYGEEAEQIDELSKKTLGSYVKKAKDQMSRSDQIAGIELGQRHMGAKPGSKERKHNIRASKRYFGIDKAVDKLTKEEVQVDEKLDMKKASMGTVVKDFQKSDAPQFQGKSQKKRQVMAIAAKLSAERGGKPLNKEERLLAKLADISETHKRTMVSVFEKLNEDNQREFMLACDTAEGIEQMLDFSISHRGE